MQYTALEFQEMTALTVHVAPTSDQRRTLNVATEESSLMYTLVVFSHAGIHGEGVFVPGKTVTDVAVVVV